MSLEYIRRTYNVPAKRGGRIRYTDEHGVVFNCTITSAHGAHLRVLVDDRVPGYRGRLTLHPTWNVEYLPAGVALPAAADALALLREVHDVLESTADSDLDHFEDEEEEREAVPVQYAARKLFQAIQLLEATPGVPAVAPAQPALLDYDEIEAIVAEVRGKYPNSQQAAHYAADRAQRAVLARNAGVTACASTEPKGGA